MCALLPSARLPGFRVTPADIMCHDLPGAGDGGRKYDLGSRPFEEALSNGLRLSLGHCAAKVPRWHFAELVVHTNQQLNLTRIVEPVEMALKNSWTA